MTTINVMAPKTKSTGHRVSMLNMGCKVNAYELEYIAETMESLNYKRVEADSSDADIFIINTCSVTAEADRQARQLVRRTIRLHPEAWIVMTGCYAELESEICSSIPGVDLVVGNADKLKIPYLISDLRQLKLPKVMRSDVENTMSVPHDLLKGFDGRSRAFVQVQQGCDQGCTFCIIHVARGPSRSFSPSAIIRQVTRFVLSGYKEIVLCGVDLGSYCSGDQNLEHLLLQIVDIEGDFRVRLSSVDPIHLTEELIVVLASSDKICPQIHLSMQSANTLILKRMKRRSTRELIYKCVENLRKSIPNLVLSADVMVGFPTEEEEHFMDTLKSIYDLEIAFPHIFSYSKRDGTPAAKIPRQIDKNEMKKRSNQLRLAGEEVKKKVAMKQIGSHRRILFEKQMDDGKLMGRAENYFPVSVQSDHMLADFSGKLFWSRITNFDGSVLQGDLLLASNTV